MSNDAQEHYQHSLIRVPIEKHDASSSFPQNEDADSSPEVSVVDELTVLDAFHFFKFGKLLGDFP